MALRAGLCQQASLCSTSTAQVSAPTPAGNGSWSRGRRTLRVAAYNNPSGAKGSDVAGTDASSQDAAMLRSMVSSQFQYSVRRAARKTTGNPISDLAYKIQLAWRIFFPEPPKQQELSPKEEVKRRLRMVLVADRCGMSPASLSEMKKTIIKALQDFVDIEGEDGIEVSITSEPGLGTVYSVNIPIRRVKAETRFALDGSEAMLPPGGVLGADGVTLEWDPQDYNSDPSSRFPMGC